MQCRGRESPRVGQIAGSGQPDPGRRHPLRRAPEHVIGRPDVDRVPVGTEGEDEIGERPGGVHPVLDEDDRRASASSRSASKSLEDSRRTGNGIEVGRRLVEDEDPGPRR